jgi:hypothetical protein
LHRVDRRGQALDGVLSQAGNGEPSRQGLER